MFPFYFRFRCEGEVEGDVAFFNAKCWDRRTNLVSGPLS